FQQLSIECTRNLLAAAQGVERFVLMSALGTEERTKDLIPYYNAKWQQEKDVKGSGLEHVLFGPRVDLRRAGPLPPPARVGPGEPGAGAALDRRRRPLFRHVVRPAGGRKPHVRVRR